MNNKQLFFAGLKDGIPIALGYLTVSFTFGITACRQGISPEMAVLISMTNLTSAGQFAGTSLIVQHAAYFEVAFAMFVINVRYALMSLSLSQKVSHKLSLWKRAVMAFSITDEIFSVASLEEEEVHFSFFLGLTTLPYIGWAAGTYIGSLTDQLLSPKMESAVGIALYGMFIALIIPASKKDGAVFKIVFLTVIITCILYFTTLSEVISSGYSIIIASIIGAGCGAYFFPREVEK